MAKLNRAANLTDVYNELYRLRNLQESSALNKAYSKVIETSNHSSLTAFKLAFSNLGVNLISYLDKAANSTGSLELTLVSNFKIGTDITKDDTRIDMVLKFTNTENNSETIMTHATGPWVNRTKLSFVI